MVERQASGSHCRDASEPVQAIYDSGSESFPDVQSEETEVGQGDGRSDGEVRETTGERETHEEGTRELAQGRVQGPREPREDATLGVGAPGQQEAVEQVGLVSLPAVPYCSIL